MPGEVKFGFSAKNEEAQKAAKKHAAARVSNVSEETRRGIRSLVVRSIRTGIPPRDAAAMIRKSVGLTGQQSLAADNYRASLVSSGMAAGTVNKEVDKFVSRKLSMRSETIARTEIMGALNAGSLESWKQAKRKGFLPKNSKKKYMATADEDTCPICAPTNRQEQGFTKPFILGNGKKVQFPPAHPSCRCTLGDPSAIVPLDAPPSILINRLPNMMSELAQYGIAAKDPSDIARDFYDLSGPIGATRVVRSAVSLDSMRRAGEMLERAGALITETVEISLRAVIPEMPLAIAAVPITEEKRKIAINLLRAEWNSRENLSRFVRSAINGQGPESALIHEYGHAAWLKAKDFEARTLANWNFYEVGIGDDFLSDAAEGDIWAHIRHNLGEYAGSGIAEFMAEAFRVSVEHGRRVLPVDILRIYDALDGPKILRGGVR